VEKDDCRKLWPSYDTGVLSTENDGVVSLLDLSPVLEYSTSTSTVDGTNI